MPDCSAAVRARAVAARDECTTNPFSITARQSRRHQFKRDSARVVTRRGRFPEGTTLFRCNSPCSAPVLHEPLQDGPDRRLDDVVELVRFDNRRRVARPALPGNMSAGSRSCRHPPRGTKTSGLSSRPSRTPARTLPLAPTLLPPVSASASPGRPTQSLPPPDVDSHATPAAVLGDFARPPRAHHVASPSQEVTTSTVARRARPS